MLLRSVVNSLAHGVSFSVGDNNIDWVPTIASRDCQVPSQDRHRLVPDDGVRSTTWEPRFTVLHVPAHSSHWLWHLGPP